MEMAETEKNRFCLRRAVHVARQRAGASGIFRKGESWLGGWEMS